MRTEKEQHVADAITFLKAARNALKAAGAKRAVAKVRAAITSTQGAERHAAGLASRIAR